ncbi:MAG: AtpZ/AtpI family protein [Dehalococcoidia bacterium]
MPWWGLALRLMGLGWYIALAILAGTLGGLWLDGVLNTRPWFTLLGVLVGSVVAFYGVYRMVVPLLGQQRPGDEESNGGEKKG